ncbi:hypothetical protein N7501_003474 [Penicillium viridicatum]|nr:hypothetical protein N7501_003474 [Penicillium viridicatum]
MNKHGDDVPLFTSQSAPGFPRTGGQKAGDKCGRWMSVNKCQKDVIDGRLVLASPRRVTGPQHHDEVRAVAGEMAYRWRDKCCKKKKHGRTDMVTTSLSSLPNRHQVAPGPVSRRRGINGKQENRKMDTLQSNMVTKSLSSLPSRHQVALGPVSRRRGINGKRETRKMKCKMESGKGEGGGA